MGLFGALFAGVSGLNSQSSKISMISNNISNVNTIGYKEVQSAFNTLVVPSGGSSFAPGGVLAATQQLVSKQGQVQGTSSGTDIAISGNGFFAVNTQSSGTAGQLLYTRSGSFTQDSSGNFINSNGFYLQGWALDANGNLPANSTSSSSLSTISIKSSSSGVATPTSTVSLIANLNAAQKTLLGAGESLNFDAASPNFGNTAKSIIIPNNGLVRGDTMNIINNGITASKDVLTYGGFTISRSVTDPTISGGGDSVGNNIKTFSAQSNSFTSDNTGTTTHLITIAAPSNGYTQGQTINISGVTGTIDGIPASQINGSQTVVSTTTNSFTISVTTASAVATSGVSSAGGSSVNFSSGKFFLNQNNPFTTDTAASPTTTHTITVSAPNNGYTVGEQITISGATNFDGITSGINGTQTVVSADANGFTFTATTNSTATTGISGGGNSNSVAPTTGSFLSQSNPLATASTATTAHTITVAAPNNGYSVGQTVTITGATSAVDGIPASLINGTHTITSASATGYTFSVTNASAINTSAVFGGGTGISFTNSGSSVIKSFLSQSSPFTTDATTGTTHTITVSAPNNGYSVGQTVNIENAVALDGIPASLLNGNQTITSVSATGFTFSVTNGSSITTTGATGGGTSVGFANRTYPFAGNMLDATTEAGTFLSTTTTSPFTPNALTFQIATTNEGSLTFKYVTTTPNAANGEFNSLDTLATAINDTTNLNARIVNGRIYVGANDANEGVTFTNGDATTNSGGTHGIDWVSELGLTNVAASVTGTKRFSNLNNLSTQINLDSQVTSTIANPLGSSTININESTPTQTIQFTDGASNTGSILRELGFKDANGNNFSSSATIPLDTNTFSVKYNSNDPNKNMSSGKITPQFTNTTTVYDALGNSHSLAINTVKISNNTWAVEVTAVPASDVTSATRTDGQLAAGVITFSGNGTLASISPSLSNAINVAWSNGANTSSISLNLGDIGASNGLSQFNLASNGTSSQNGSSAGNLTGVSIDSNGYVISTFSNGQTQKVFKIPLIQINNPDGLESVSGDAFSQTQSSGIATAVSAGTNGTGTITPSALESSTVDLSTQLTNLIVAQQAYGANSKLLTVADRLLQQLDQVIQ